MVHATGIGDSNTTASVRSFMHFALVALEKPEYPACYFGLNTAVASPSSKIPITRVARVVAGYLRIGKLLGRWSPALVFRNLLVAIGLGVQVVDGHFFWTAFLWNSPHRKTRAGAAQSKTQSELLRSLARHCADASLGQFA